MNRNKLYLIIFNVVLIISLILLTNLKVLPLQMGDFLFFTVLSLALALYRPAWCFLLFMGVLPLENINLAPDNVGLIVRPYQFLGALTMLALVIRSATGKLSFKLIRPKWYDYLVLFMGLSSFLSALLSETVAASIKLSIIMLSFIALYFLTRTYIQTLSDLKNVIPFIISSSVVISLYGLWQNVQFLQGANHFEVMPGRPNSTFAEADWLGMYLTGLLALIYSLMYYFHRSSQPTARYVYTFIPSQIKDRLSLAGLYGLLTLVYLTLILTVSRSAWLGSFLVTFLYIFMQLTGLRFRSWQWKAAGTQAALCFVSVLISLGILTLFPVTDFQLGNRLQSTGTGLQEITISCPNSSCQPAESIASNEDLRPCNCRHINLDEIPSEQALGKTVLKVYRHDPNISIRKDIYHKSLDQIRSNPILGIGWGSIGLMLGQDERGTNLNTSNIFLELWLGAGLLALLGFLVIIAKILVSSASQFFYAQKDEERAVFLFIMLGWFAVIVPNLFNAGILLAFLWVYLAISGVKKNRLPL